MKYNGYTNYATWRVMLEIVDGLTFELEDEVDAQYMEDLIDEMLFDAHPQADLTLIADYARAFLADVNYYEIAERVNEHRKEIQ